ncbi:caspase family protein [Alphaproteobacteria bacterium]|nr:caspase family protein [Alphaproteobacteria bacterium]
MMFQEGKGVEKNYIKARKNYNIAFKLAKNNSYVKGQAAYYVAQSYYYATNAINRNIKKAIELYKLADKNGYNRANYDLGYIYLTGKHLKKDLKKSFYFFNRGALLWDVDSMRELGNAYKLGYGVAVNYKKAHKYFSRAAIKDDIYSQYMVAKYYHEGLVEDINLDKAFKWYKIASFQNHPNAQLNLGKFYEKGFGISKNNEKALKWYKKASLNKNISIRQMAQNNYDNLKLKVSKSNDKIDDDVDILKLKDEISDLKIVSKYNQRGLTNTSNIPLAKNNQQKFYALLIGVENYDNLIDLKTPMNDINKISNILKNKYGFNITLLKNPTREQITKTLNNLSKILTKNDNLLIYYAGHGTEVKKKGHWLPSNAEKDDDTHWISNDYLSRKLNNINAMNILVIADSCFSGTLTRNISGAKTKIDKSLKVYLGTKSRIVISSGGLKPVLDGGGGDNSIFAGILISYLTNNFEALTATKLYNGISQDVLKLSMELGFQQTPMLANLPTSGHVGPDFVFLPKY